jgi:hypothetical protein
MDGWMNQQMDGHGWMHGGTYCYEKGKKDLNTKNSRKRFAKRPHAFQFNLDTLSEWMDY